MTSAEIFIDFTEGFIRIIIVSNNEQQHLIIGYAEVVFCVITEYNGLIIMN